MSIYLCITSIDIILYLLQLQCYLLREAFPDFLPSSPPSPSLHPSVARAWQTVGAQEIAGE